MSLDRYIFSTHFGHEIEDEKGNWVLAEPALARIAELEAELARLRPLAELYPLAWEECKWMRRNTNMTQWVVAKVAHDKARAERGVGQ